MTDAIPTSSYDPDERFPDTTIEAPEPLASDEPGEADEPVVEDDDGETNGGEA